MESRCPSLQEEGKAGGLYHRRRKQSDHCGDTSSLQMEGGTRSQGMWLQRLEKARRQILPSAPEGTTALTTPPFPHKADLGLLPPVL